MLINEIKEDQIYWTIQTNDEHLNYESDPVPRKPYRVKAKWINYPGEERKFVRIYRFNSGSGEIDNDPNCYHSFYSVKNEVSGVFNTFEEAKIAYHNEVNFYCKVLRNMVEDLEKDLVEYDWDEHKEIYS